MLGGEGDHLIGDVTAGQTSQMPDSGIDLIHRYLVGGVGGDEAVYGGGPALPVRRVVDVFRHKGVGAVQREHTDGGSLLVEGRRHVQLAEVRLGQDGDLMSHVGRRAAGIIHRAADGLDDSAVKIHVGVLSNLADDERVEFFHNDHPFRRPAPAQEVDGALRPQGRKADGPPAEIQGKIKSDQRTQTFALLTAISIIGEDQKVNGFSSLKRQPPSFCEKPEILCRGAGKRDCKQRKNRV